ncbi:MULTISPECIES: CapA family protein [Terrabacteria group]|uniref:CapA family protein n=1 Tax=Bacillati TaxID=1783272 RepID=UPI0019399FC7|nr:MULTISPECIES: CapA family protein [Terrabacteria group]MBW9212995.1 CapA family protein [Trueperella sp. zg.1013]QRG87038.1 CapA family protein [Bulleidia sp. zg-1006]
MKKKLWKILYSVLLLASMVAIYVLHPKPANKLTQTIKTQKPTEKKEVKSTKTSATLFMVGDSLIHNSVYKDAKKGNTYDFTKQIELIGQSAKPYDLRYYNQETILGGSALGLSSYPLFNSPQEWGQNMIDQGFNLVSTATNHSLDKGEAGIMAQRKFFDQHPEIIAEGTYTSKQAQQAIRIHEVNGIKYTFFSWTYGMNGFKAPVGKDYLVNCYEGREQEMLQQIKEAKKQVDVVLVAIHWGIEYQDMPSPEQKRLAQALADAGTDIIIGNHPHTIQPIQWLNNRKSIVFYAFGNMISDQWNREQSMNGYMASIRINKTIDNGITTITLDDLKTEFIYTYSKPRNHNFKVYPYSQLSTKLYPNKEKMNKTLTKVITALDSSIPVNNMH